MQHQARMLRFLALGLLAALLSGCAPSRHYEALLVLADAAQPERPTRLKATTPTPSRQAIDYVVEGRRHSGDLYLPGDGVAEAGIVLVPGAVPQGKDEPRLVAFATTLARARFAVLTPDLSGFRQLRIAPADAREVADAVAHLSGRPDLAPGGRAGIVAFSYAVGPAVLAALEDDVRQRLRFILGMGGYHDLGRAVRFFTTGWFEHEGRWQHLEPDPYGTLVLVMTSLGYLGAADRRTLEAMVEARLAQPDADLSELAERLGPEGRAVFELAENADPHRFPELMAALPAALRADMAALSLHDKALDRLQARLILVHGRNDSLIPYTESIALARALPEGQARLILIERILGHVDLTLTHLLTWQFWRHELPDIWRMFRATDALLREREARRGADTFVPSGAAPGGE